jgi:uncharacterized membrane protein YqhA
MEEERPASPDHANDPARTGATFHRMLLLSRYVILLPVLASIFLALFSFYVATIDILRIIIDGVRYHVAESGEDVSSHLVAGIIKVVDVYLVTGFLLIFAFGFYELFIGKLPLLSPESVLRVRNFDDLKTRLGRTALLVLVVLFLEQAELFSYKRATDLLVLAGGITLIGIALHLTQREGPG